MLIRQPIRQPSRELRFTGLVRTGLGHLQGSPILSVAYLWLAGSLASFVADDDTLKTTQDPPGKFAVIEAPSIVESFFVIFAGAATLSVVALFTRQPLILAYILIGYLAGPGGAGLVTDAALISEIAEIGIIFLLFLIGLDLQPKKLANMLGESLLTALGSSFAFFAVSCALMLAFGFSYNDALFVGIAMIFSSTIIGIKLLPTTVLHHRHVGEIVISLLLIQDLLAIIALLLVGALSTAETGFASQLLSIVIALPLLSVGALAIVRWILLPLFTRFDAFHEFLFIVAVGWCLGCATIAQAFNLSFELGAFVAGVSLATSPVAQYIADQLRPLRDFFLVMFFFAVGASIDVPGLAQVWAPIVLLAVCLLVVKPLAFTALLGWQGETWRTAREVGFRLGQGSEFALLLTFAASETLLSPGAANVVQGVTVVTFVISSYLVVLHYPSPIAVDARLRRD